MTMPKKPDFTANKTTTTPAVDPLRAKATKGTTNTPDTKATKDAKEEYRFNARFTPEQWHFLEEKKWQESAKNHKQTSITAILQNYVEADMKKHPEILKTIDELNS